MNRALFGLVAVAACTKAPSPPPPTPLPLDVSWFREVSVPGTAIARSPITGSQRSVFDGPNDWKCAVDREHAKDAEHGFLGCEDPEGHLVQTMTTCMTTREDCAWSTLRIGDNVSTTHVMALACATPAKQTCGDAGIVENYAHYVPREAGPIITPGAPYFTWTTERSGSTKTMTAARDPITIAVDDWVCQFTVDPQPQTTPIYQHLELARLTCVRPHAMVETSVLCAETLDAPGCSATALRFGAAGQPWDSLILTCKSPRGCSKPARGV